MEKRDFISHLKTSDKYSRYDSIISSGERYDYFYRILTEVERRRLIPIFSHLSETEIIILIHVITKNKKSRFELFLVSTQGLEISTKEYQKIIELLEIVNEN